MMHPETARRMIDGCLGPRQCAALVDAERLANATMSTHFYLAALGLVRLVPELTEDGRAIRDVLLADAIATPASTGSHGQ